MFVKLVAREKWLFTATCGNSDANRTAFGRTSLLTILREHITRLPDGIDAVDVAPDVWEEDYDPMVEITGTRLPTGAVHLPADVRARARYYKNRAKNCMATVNVASRCREIDPTCAQMRSVKLYITDRKPVWLHLDDVAWAIRYLLDQHCLKMGFRVSKTLTRGLEVPSLRACPSGRE